MSVFVLGNDGRPVMPCTERRARLLLERGKAKVVRIVPFTIQLKDRNQDNCELQHIEVKIDPGSKTTGLCISRTDGKVVNILNLFELEHRGRLISYNLKARAALRRNRRHRKTRYRQARFLNRTRAKGWFPPSLQHRVDTTLSWVRRFQRYLPVTSLAVERVKFDMQKMRQSDISGRDYQQGELFQYEVMEYLLEKWGRKCVYCDADRLPLEREHIVAKARGGSNSISNLTLSCHACNQAKGILPIEVFLAHKPDVLKKIKAQLKTPLKDATAVNATRNALFSALLKTGLPVATGTGAQTKYNRKYLSVPKTHALDAACLGDVQQVTGVYKPHTEIQCNGRGQYTRTIMDKFGFPRCKLPRTKKVFGFSTGDMVSTWFKTREGIKKIIVRIAVRTRGYFSFKYNKNIFDVKWSNCQLVQRNDGYSYARKPYRFLAIHQHILTLGQL